MGVAAHRLLICIAVLCTVFSALRQVCIFVESNLQIEFILVSFGVLTYSHGPSIARITKQNNNARRSFITKSVIDRVAENGGQQARPAVPTQAASTENGTPKHSEDLLGHEPWRLKMDVRTVVCAQREGVAHNGQKMLQVMHACIRLGHGEAAVELFDQMLEKGVVVSPRCTRAVSHKFFKLVVESLDDTRIQEDGLRLLDVIQSHGIRPSPTTQNRVLAAWKNQLPESVLKYFLRMKSEGVIMSRWAYRYIVVAHERADPAFALKIYGEMEELGVEPDRATYNSVLDAYYQLGMYHEAQELFVRAVSVAPEPNAKSFGIMIKVC